MSCNKCGCDEIIGGGFDQNSQLLTLFRASGKHLTIPMPMNNGGGDGGGDSGCCVTGLNYNSSTGLLTVQQTNASPQSVTITQPGQNPDCCVSGMMFNSTTNQLSLTQTNGPNFTATIPVSTGGGEGCCVTDLDFDDNTNTLTLIQSGGPNATTQIDNDSNVDEGCCITGLVFDNATRNLTVAQSNGLPFSVTIPSADVDPGCCNTALSYDQQSGLLSLEQSNGINLTTALPVVEECCNTSLTYDDVTGLLAITQSNGPALSVTIPPANTSGGDGCCNLDLTFNAGTGALVLTQTDGDPVSVTLPTGVVDTFGVPELAVSGGTDAWGQTYVADDQLIQFPGNLTVCIPRKETCVVSNTPITSATNSLTLSGSTFMIANTAGGNIDLDAIFQNSDCEDGARLTIGVTGDGLVTVTPFPGCESICAEKCSVLSFKCFAGMLMMA